MPLGDPTIILIRRVINNVAILKVENQLALLLAARHLTFVKFTNPTQSQANHMRATTAFF